MKMKKGLENFVQGVKEKANEVKAGIESIKDMYQLNEFGSGSRPIHNSTLLSFGALPGKPDANANISKDKVEQHEERNVENSSQKDNYNSIGFNQALKQMNAKPSAPIFGGDEDPKVKEATVFSGTGKDIDNPEEFEGVTLHNTMYHLFDSEDGPFELSPQDSAGSMVKLERRGGNVTDINREFTYTLSEVDKNRVYLRSIKEGVENNKSPYAIDMRDARVERDKGVVSGSFTYKSGNIEDNLRRMEVENDGEVDTFYYPYNNKIDSKEIKNGKQLPMYFVKSEDGEPVVGIDGDKPFLQGQVYKATVAGDFDKDKWVQDTCENGEEVGLTYDVCYLDEYRTQIDEEKESDKGNPGHVDQIVETEDSKGGLEGRLRAKAYTTVGGDYSQDGSGVGLNYQVRIAGNDDGGQLYWGIGTRLSNVSTKDNYRDAINTSGVDFDNVSLSAEVSGKASDNYRLERRNVFDGVPLTGFESNITYENGPVELSFGAQASARRGVQNLKEDYNIIYRNDQGEIINTQERDREREFTNNGWSVGINAGLYANVGETFDSDSKFLKNSYVGVDVRRNITNVSREFDFAGDAGSPGHYDNAIENGNINFGRNSFWDVNVGIKYNIAGGNER